MLEPRSSFVETDDIRLHYLEWDPEYFQKSLSGEPSLVESRENTDNIPVLLLHGLGATADTWRLVAEYLYSHHYLLAFDMPGHGQSDQSEHGYEVAVLAEDIINATAKLGLGQVAVVAHGWGARIALALAARHPALISHLILVDCPLMEPRHWPGMTRDRFIREKMSPGTYISCESYLQFLRREMFSFWSPEVEDIVLTYVQHLPDGRVQELLLPEQQSLIHASLWEDRVLSYYGKLRCPVLLMPAADKPLPGAEPPEKLEVADEFSAAKGQLVVQVARTIERCSVFWMPDTTHDIQLQRPHVLAKAVADFLQE